MRSLFSLDSPLVKWLNTLTDLFVLNILWLICCIPIITIGASTSAMYSVTIKMIKDEDTGIARPFFNAFKKDFKQATVRYLILVVTALILYGDYRIIAKTADTIVLYAVLTFGIVLWLFVEAFVFPLTAYFDNSHANTFKNAFLLSVVNFPRSVLIVILKISPALLAIFNFEFFYKTSFIWIAFGWALLAYINSYIFRVVFEQISVSKEA